MKGIWFDDIHSYNNLHLVLSKPVIPPAKIKWNLVDVPGADGSVDLTESHGEVKFKDRECTFTFTVLPSDNFEEKKKEVSNLLNGRRCKIRLDKDPNYYWLGRCSIDDYASDKNLHKIVVGATVQPYKYKLNKTIVSVHFCGKNLFDNHDFDVLRVNSTQLTSIDSGIRATATSTSTSVFSIVKFLPVKMLIGKTITLSTTMQASEGHNPSCRLGYCSADGEKRQSVITLSKSGSASMTVEDVDFDYVGIWFYGNLGNSSSVVGGYADYTNLQIEIDNIATEYEPYTPVDSHDIILTNSRKTVCPTIICTDTVTIMVGDAIYTLSEGTHKVLNFQLFEGETPVSLVGAGAISFNYQEGDL